MGFRDILAQLMAGGGRSGGGAPVGQDEYQALLQREMARYGGDRDQAVRNANIAGGFGNSTAQQFMHPAAAAAVDPTQTGALPANVPVPTPRPEVTANVPIPTPRPENAPIPVPTPAPTRFSPDLAVSPRHEPDRMAASAPTAATLPPVPPAPTQFSPDLAVSPRHEPDRMSRSAPKGPKKGKRVRQFALEPDPARFGR